MGFQRSFVGQREWGLWDKTISLFQIEKSYFVAYFCNKVAKLKKALVLDRIGMCTSVICMVHCLAIPLFFLFGLDTLLRVLDQEWIEWTIIFSALVIGVVSFLGGYLTHRQHFVPVLFVAGFLLIVNGESVAHAWVSVGLSVSGAVVIAYAHIQNLKLRRYA